MTCYRSDRTPIQKVATYGFETAPLATNRQINREASKYFYGNNLFIRIRFNTNAFKATSAGEDAMMGTRITGLDFIDGDKALDLKRDLTAMTAYFTWPRVPCTSVNEFIIAYQDLRLFLLVLWKANISQEDFLQGCHLHLEVLNTFGMPDKHVQHRLLDPWRRVVNLESVSITGNVRPQYAEELAIKLMSSKSNHESRLRFTHTIEEMGCIRATQWLMSDICYHWHSAMLDLMEAKDYRYPILPLHILNAMSLNDQKQLRKRTRNAMEQPLFRLRLRLALIYADGAMPRRGLRWCKLGASLCNPDLMRRPPSKRPTVMLQYVHAWCHFSVGDKDFALSVMRWVMEWNPEGPLLED